ncbi:SigE family RNA polymerase sigma factor [Rugosimonospora africana]|uniref:DNA-directed RNA polymerase sigma-70 factor n=1 Tax=Rugosimonospora africana TaxID=556532 RepID=A0A8J3VW91_9ACTN|nr:SigE family RNA polymerase sigma factor [Rugosimonospora africana]GIH20591.1 DNA-directed RNA polymerase sigma-70 factor [Rugosimonospora africana]
MNGEERQKFREFVAARTPALMRTAYLLAGNQHDAEDLLQNALTRTAARFSSIRHTDPEAYVRRVMYREQISWWRRFTRRRESPTHPMPDRPAADPSTGTDLRVVVGEALRQLTPRQRTVLVLRYFEDLPEQQVAELMNCSVGTVRSQTARAMARFRAVAPELGAPARQGTEVRR